MSHYFITGVSAGIGAALCRQLLAEGHRVSGMARRQNRLDDLAATSPLFHGITGDVTDAEAVEAAILSAETHHGDIDVMVLNAGVYTPQDGRALDLSVFRQHMEVNYMGVVNGLVPMIPKMVARGKGHLVIMASVSGWVGLPKAAAYGPTKAALISLTESLWFDLTPSGIKVQVVCPGFVDTEATAVNDFEMPGLMTPDAAASALRKGMASDAFEITFPKGFTRMMRMLRHLPYRLYFRLIRQRTNA